jgi:hypothetical protein
MPFTIVTQGKFTSAGVGVKIPMPSGADYFFTRNITQLATTNATGRVVMGEWFSGSFAANDGIRYKKTNSTSALNVDLFSTSTASNGFTYVPTVPYTEAAVTGGTAITAASPAVVSITNTYSEGDRVRLYGTTGMLQIAGMDFTISSVSGSGFTLLGLDASGFAAAATGLTARRISQFDAVEPRYLYITKISQASQAVVTVSTAHDYVVGELIYFSVPQSFGMQEISGLTGKITAVGTYTMTVDIDSSTFTAFAFPASTAVPGTQLFATLAPGGQRTQENYITGVQTGYDFGYPPFHTGEFSPYMYIAAGAQSPAGSASDEIVWFACKSETGVISA